MESRDVDGYFWLPTEPDNSKPGRLVTSSTGEVRLAINGTFEPLQVPPPMAEIPRLFGVTKNGEFVTLVHCIPDHFRFRAPGYASQSLVVMRAYIGAHIVAEQESFNSVTVYLSHLHDW